MNDIQIVPAILATTEQEYREEVNKIQSSRKLSDGWVHIDLMDNKFVPNESISPSIMAKYPMSLKKEAHLMVTTPYALIDNLKNMGFESIIVHVESEDVKKSLRKIASFKLKAGLAIKHQTSLEKIIPYLTDIDLVLIMSIKAGFQGQPFQADSLERIRQVQKMRSERNLNFKIAVDGAVKDQNANLLVAAGADQLVVGSFLLEGDINKNIETFWKAIYG